jgi:hypothetical protein
MTVKFYSSMIKIILSIIISSSKLSFPNQDHISRPPNLHINDPSLISFHRDGSMVPSFHVHHIEQRPNSWTKSTQKLMSFPLCYWVTSTALPWDLYFSKRNLLQFLQFSNCTLHRRKEENLIDIHTESSSLRTLKIRPRNLNEIVRLWIQLLCEGGGQRWGNLSGSSWDSWEWEIAAGLLLTSVPSI